MATLRAVQARIFRLEGFNVRFRHRYHSKNARDDMKGIAAYPFKLMAMNKMTVSGWKRGRFQGHYPGFRVDVLDASGNNSNGNMRLSTVRDTYLGRLPARGNSRMGFCG